MNEQANAQELAEAELEAAIRAGSPPEMADALAARLTYVLRPWLVAHDEEIRTSERVRLAGEVEALAGEITRWSDTVENATSAEVGRWVVRRIEAALVPVPGVRLTEET